MKMYYVLYNPIAGNGQGKAAAEKYRSYDFDLTGRDWEVIGKKFLAEVGNLGADDAADGQDGTAPATPAAPMAEAAGADEATGINEAEVSE